MERKIVRPPHALGTIALVLAMMAMPSLGHSESTRASEAQQPLTESKSVELQVSWAEIVKLVDEHPKIVGSKQKTAAARAAIDAAGAVPNPEFEATTGYGQARNGSASRVEWGLGLSIPMDWIAQRGAKVDAADAEARVADAEAKALRLDVLLELRTLFWNLVHEQERVSTLSALDAETTRLADTVRRRVEKGENRPVEATRVEIEAQKIAGELAIARSTMQRRRVQLGLWLGVGQNKKLTAVANLAKLPQAISLENARARIRTSHPDIIAADARVLALEAAVRVERRARMPSVSVRAFTTHELDRAAYGFGLMISLPVWNWNTGNIRRAEAYLAAGKSQLDADRMNIESTVIEAQAACQAGLGLALRYRDQIQPRAALAAQTIERTYKLGEATLLEVIDARRTLLDTKTRLLATLAQAQTECSRLAVLAGENLP